MLLTKIIVYILRTKKGNISNIFIFKISTSSTLTVLTILLFKIDSCFRNIYFFINFHLEWWGIHFVINLLFFSFQITISAQFFFSFSLFFFFFFFILFVFMQTSKDLWLYVHFFWLEIIAAIFDHVRYSFRKSFYYYYFIQSVRWLHSFSTNFRFFFLFQFLNSFSHFSLNLSFVFPSTHIFLRVLSIFFLSFSFFLSFLLFPGFDCIYFKLSLLHNLRIRLLLYHSFRYFFLFWF